MLMTYELADDNFDFAVHTTEVLIRYLVILLDSAHNVSSNASATGRICTCRLDQNLISFILPTGLATERPLYYTRCE